MSQVLALFAVACTDPNIRNARESVGEGDGGHESAPADASTAVTCECDTDPRARCNVSGQVSTCQCPDGFEGDGRGQLGCRPLLDGISVSPGEVRPSEVGASDAYTLRVPRWTEQLSWVVDAAPSVSVELGSNMFPAGEPTALPLPPDVMGLDLSLHAGGASSPHYAMGIERREERVRIFEGGSTDNSGVAISASEQWVAIGASMEDGSLDDETNEDFENSGAVYVYRVDPHGVWTREAYLKATPPIAEARFGWSVSIQGTRLAVGSKWAPFKPSQGDELSKAGAVYLFERDANGTWQPREPITSDAPTANEYFGLAVALDGDRVAIGAPFNAQPVPGDPAAGSGSVYVFKRYPNGVWGREARVFGSNSQPQDQFGWSVSLSGDWLAAGAPNEDAVSEGTSIPYAGAAYAVHRDEDGMWREKSHLVEQSPGAYHMFGSALVLNGTRLAVTSPHETSSGIAPIGTADPHHGETYIYEAADGEFLEAAKIDDVAADGDQAPCASLAFDGDLLAIGDVEYRASGKGRAYVFKRNGDGTWQERATVFDMLSADNDWFGYGVAFLRGGLLVGVPNAFGPQSQRPGAVYYFH